MTTGERDERRSSSPSGEELLRLDGITKRFPGVVALRNVTFDVRSDEVHVLFGENGAGKSTLINLIAGAYTPDAGTMTLDGRPVSFRSPHEARRQGISAVFQEFSLVPMLSVAENIFLGRELDRRGVLRKSHMTREARRAMQDLDPTLDVHARLGSLPRARQQMVEIAKALQADPKILILDEPTTSLTEHEVERLFVLVQTLKSKARGIVYITHRIREIPRIGDRVTVLRDGERVATLDVADADEAQLIRLMSGRSLDTLYPSIPQRSGSVRLRLSEVSTPQIEGISLSVRSGEIVGVAGLAGSGKSDIARVCVGAVRATSGTIEVNGQVLERPSVTAAFANGLVYHPADRRTEGLVLVRSVRENLTLAALDEPEFSVLGFLRRSNERRRARDAVSHLDVRPPDIERTVALLSGGNQQKVMIGRALFRNVTIHLFDEPTLGLDVGAKAEVHAFMKALVESGCAVLLISSDLLEIVNLAHRVYVVHAGLIRAELHDAEISEERILANFFDVMAPVPTAVPSGSTRDQSV